MVQIKLESPGLMVHYKLKSMARDYGVMMTGVPADVIGQMQAERSLPRIYKTGNIRQQIANEVIAMNHMMTEPTQSCGQASNDVCDIFLGKSNTEKFHAVPYEQLSTDGSNLKNAIKSMLLTDANLLIRFEVDRTNYPTAFIKVKNDLFQPKTAQRNKIYLLENKLYFLDSSGHVFDLGASEKKCQELFNAIIKYGEHSMCDPFVLEYPDKPEDFAIIDIANIFHDQQETFDCWLGSHSFLIYMPQAPAQTSPLFYPYQAYFGSHTLQDWLASNKDEYLSQAGLDKYIDQLVLLGNTTQIKIRSDIYSELFAKRGRELYFCANLNERREQVRVKFKITEVNPSKALENFQDLQGFIDSHPGENAADKVNYYSNRTKEVMAEHLQSLLSEKSELNNLSFWHNNNENKDGDKVNAYSEKKNLSL